MKKILMFLLIGLISLVSCFALTHITDCQGFSDIRNNLNENYTLDNNIDCNGYTVSMISGFAGGLDCNKYEINNLIIYPEYGIFAFLFDDSYIKYITNCNFNNLIINGDGSFASFIGYTSSSNFLIENISISGIVNPSTNEYIDYSALVNWNVGSIILKNSYINISTSPYWYIEPVFFAHYQGDMTIINSYSINPNATCNNIAGTFNNSFVVSDTCKRYYNATNEYTTETLSSYFYDISNEPMTSWDFTNVWSTQNNLVDYPIFKWQETPVHHNSTIIIKYRSNKFTADKNDTVVIKMRSNKYQANVNDTSIIRYMISWLSGLI